MFHKKIVITCPKTIFCDFIVFTKGKDNNKTNNEPAVTSCNIIYFHYIVHTPLTQLGEKGVYNSNAQLF